MLPFADLVVLELASVLAGPSVGQFFAELGATVLDINQAVIHQSLLLGMMVRLPEAAVGDEA
ncbi:MAG: ACT domain-containing protein, partial [Bacteroidota bacterium]